VATSKSSGPAAPPSAAALQRLGAETLADQSEVLAADGATVILGKDKAVVSSDDPTLSLNEKDLDAQARKAAAPPAARASTLGDYKLLKKLGQGGMGAVYKAHQISLDRDVAVKVLSRELAAHPSFVQRFQREARVMAKLDHPNILRCFEVGEALGHHYIAMEFVEGGSVDAWLQKKKRFDVADALCIIIAAARALEYAHEQGTVHRDIKPDNILLTKKGAVKVADLGLAKAQDDDLSLTRTGTGAGTPLYMAPEQARDVKHVDGRCDIYSLGVMLYVFLTGQAPFGGTTLVEIVEAKEKGKFKPIRMFNPEVPERLDLIVDKMLAKEPKLRFSTCTEVVEELEGLGLAGETLSFFENATSAAAKAAPAKAAPTRTPAAPAAKTEQPSPAARATLAPAAPEPDIWYWSFKDPKGHPVTKKLTASELMTLIKSGSLDSKAQISKTLTGGYRAVASYVEYEPYFRGKIAEKKAARGAQTYKNVLQQIEEEEARRQKMKWLKGLFAKFGSAVGLIVWLAVVGAIVVGGYFTVVWILAKVR
jgi:serine/threonine protein kinase